jgi:hypothetical protein
MRLGLVYLEVGQRQGLASAWERSLISSVCILVGFCVRGGAETFQLALSLGAGPRALHRLLCLSHLESGRWGSLSRRLWVLALLLQLQRTSLPNFS